MTTDIMQTGTNTVEKTVELPSPTAWPIILAFGLSLLFAGMVTSASISFLGGILAVIASIGWFRDVLPHERHEFVTVGDEKPSVSTKRTQVARVEWINQELPRARLPLEIYPISAGVKGGLAGGAVMAVLAIAYGVISHRGIWFPINLLSAGFFPARDSAAQLAQFHWDTFIVATLVHLITSFLVGLLYGATLPMFPRRPILLGGLIAPILWSGLLHSTLDLINPVLNERIDWPWFVVSQIGFGIVAGIVVSRQEQVSTWQHLHWMVRAGFETPGAMDERDTEQRNERGGEPPR